MQEFDELIQVVNNNRPFRMYIHGCDKDSAQFMMDTPKSRFHIFERDSIASTVANCGTVKTDYQGRFRDYQYWDKDANLILIMPDAISIEQYCGAIHGQRGVTRGYGNHIELDYTLMAAVHVINGEPIERGILDQAPNQFLLGYYDKTTDEFVLNQNCILFMESPAYDNITQDIRNVANARYTFEMGIPVKDIALRYQGTPTGDAARKIDTTPELHNEYRLRAHIDYMQSAEAKYDADYENTNLLIDYENPSNSHAYNAIGDMVEELSPSDDISGND